MTISERNACVSISIDDVTADIPKGISESMMTAVIREWAMLNSIIVKKTIYIVTVYTNMRKGIDGLFRESFILIRTAKHCFCTVEGIHASWKYFYGRDGFLLLSKRLENGKCRWSRNEYETIKLSEWQLRWLPEGLEIEQNKAIKLGKQGVLYWIHSMSEDDLTGTFYFCFLNMLFTH